MTHRNVHIVSVLMGLAFFQVANVNLLRAQSSPTRHWNLSGPYDSAFPPPSVEGKFGQKDPSALSEFREFATETTPQGWSGVQAEGTLMVGGGQGIKEYSASLVVEKGAKYRLDLREGSESSSVRVDGLAGARMQANGTLQRLTVTQLGSPFFLPSELLQIANSPNVSAIDDGLVVIEGQRLHKITLIVPTIPQSPRMTTGGDKVTAVNYYFDPIKHYLLKKVLVGHFPGDITHEYLQVTTYNDYRSIQGAIAPSVISETSNGQHGMTFKASNMSETENHDASYFHF